MIKKITRVYLFDFDDTLVNNHKVDLQSFNITLKKHKLPQITKEKLLYLRKKGKLAEEIFSQITKNQETKSLVMERKKILANLKIWKKLELNNGVKKTLKIIKKRKEPIIIISRKSSEIITKLLPGLGIEQYIDQVYTTKKKKTFIVKLMQKYPDCKFIFVSDSEQDLLPVKNLGIKTFCFYNKYKNMNNMRKLAKVIFSLEKIL